MMPARIEGLQVFDDVSGVTAVVRCNGFSFAYNLIGEVRCTLIGGSGTRRQRLVAQSIADRAFQRAIATLSPEWLAANKAMYAQCARCIARAQACIENDICPECAAKLAPEWPDNADPDPA
jgi:hypothetical protein